MKADHAPAQEPGAIAVQDGADDAETRLYRSIFDSITSQRLTPGTKLPEAELCVLFGVGRSVVRKVLQRLAHEHMVQLRPNRGAIVAVPTPLETGQIFEARRALESAIVTLVAQRATPADLQGLRTQLQQEHEALHGLDQPAWVRLASRFHLQLAALSGNPILQRYLVETVSRCSLIVALHQRSGNHSCEHDEHVAIVDCIAKGDGDGAVALMEAHLHELEQHLALKSSPAPRGLAQLLGMG